MTVRWTVHVIHMLSIQHKRHKLNLTAKTYYDKFFLFNSFSFFISYNLRIIQEYFQPKLGRKIRIFSLGRKNDILIKKKSVHVWRLFTNTLTDSIDYLHSRKNIITPRDNSQESQQPEQEILKKYRRTDTIRLRCRDGTDPLCFCTYWENNLIPRF